MANNIRILIQEAQTAFERNDHRTAKRKALEATVGAQNAKDTRILYQNEVISDTDLADCFGTIAVILNKVHAFYKWFYFFIINKDSLVDGI